MSIFALKCIALFCMLCDHIGYFFFTAGAPIWLRYLGRLAAPIFFFALSEGMAHTRDRARYLLRLYLASGCMALLMLLLKLLFPAYGSALSFNIFATLFVGAAILYLQHAFAGDDAAFLTVFGGVLVLVAFCYTGLSILEPNSPLAATGACGALILSAGVLEAFLFFSDSRHRRALHLCAAFLALQGAGSFLYLWLSAAPKTALWGPSICNLLLPSFASIEGGWPWALMALVFHLLRRNRSVQLAGYIVYSLLVFLPWGDLTFSGLLLNFQWMMVFASILLYFYNGTRGHSCKWLFYLFYPGHIAALFFIWIAAR